MYVVAYSLLYIGQKVAPENREPVPWFAAARGLWFRSRGARAFNKLHKQSIFHAYKYPNGYCYS